MFGNTLPNASFVQALADKANLAIGQIAQAAMHEFGRGSRSGGREIAFFDQRRFQPAQGAIQRNRRTGRPAANNRHVKGRIFKSRKNALHEMSQLSVGNRRAGPSFSRLPIDGCRHNGKKYRLIAI